jgi:capsule biosynthesis phosphatase
VTRRLTIVFDLDGTLCEQGDFAGYAEARPLPHALARVKEAYDRGHRVVIQTARGMKRFGGDAARCREELFALTAEWLARHGVPYHELRFGKASADLYVDDKGCRVAGEADWEASYDPVLRVLEKTKP